MSPAGDTRPKSNGHRNRATGIITMVPGMTFAIAGIHHGFFETLQGNTPTKSFIIQSIGPSQLMWQRGTDKAFTVIPNFLMTGISAMAVSLAIVIWSVRFIDRRCGPTIFLLLFILLTLVGGGMGMTTALVQVL